MQDTYHAPAEQPDEPPPTGRGTGVVMLVLIGAAVTVVCGLLVVVMR